MKLLDFSDRVLPLPSSLVLGEMARNDEYFDQDPPYSSAHLKEYFEKYYGTKYYEKVPISFSDEESFEPTSLTPIELEFKVPFSAVNNLVMKSLQTLDQESMIKFAEHRLYEKESYVQEQIRESLEDIIFAITVKEEKTVEQRLTASVEIEGGAIPVAWPISHDLPGEDMLTGEEKELKKLPHPDLGEITIEVQELLQTLDFSE
jgi:hypothetical protein